MFTLMTELKEIILNENKEVIDLNFEFLNAHQSKDSQEDLPEEI